MTSIICIQESWLTEQDDLSHIQLEGYISFGKNSSTKGGLILYVLDTIIKYYNVLKMKPGKDNYLKSLGGLKNL